MRTDTPMCVFVNAAAAVVTPEVELDAATVLQAGDLTDLYVLWQAKLLGSTEPRRWVHNNFGREDRIEYLDDTGTVRLTAYEDGLFAYLQFRIEEVDARTRRYREHDPRRFGRELLTVHLAVRNDGYCTAGVDCYDQVEMEEGAGHEDHWILLIGIIRSNPEMLAMLTEWSGTYEHDLITQVKRRLETMV